MRFAFDDLVVNPGVGFFQAVPKAYTRLPAQILFDQRVVAVAAVDTFRSFEVVRALELDSSDAFYDVDQAIDGDDLVAAEVERFKNVAGENRLRAARTRRPADSTIAASRTTSSAAYIAS